MSEPSNGTTNLEVNLYPVATLNNDAIFKLRVQQLASFVGNSTYAVLLNFPSIFFSMNLKIQTESIEKNVASLGGTLSKTFNTAYYVYHPTTQKYHSDIKKSVSKFEKRAGFVEKRIQGRQEKSGQLQKREGFRK